MSVQSPAGGRQPVLPEAFSSSLHHLAIRVVGGGLVAFAAISWLALVSWQVRDPRVVGLAKAPGNLLGSFGAALSDMLVQTIGVAVVFALVCPMIWGMEMLAGLRWIPRLRVKLVAYFTALLALAAFASGLPRVPGWPLPGGAGGMLGDIVYNFAATTAPRLGTDSDALILLLALGVAGMALVSKALGFALPKLRRTAHGKAATQHAGADMPTGGVQDVDEPARASPAKPRASEPGAATGHERRAPIAHSAPAEASAGEDDATDVDAEEAETTARARAFAQRFAPGVATGTPPAAPKRLAATVRALATRRAEVVYRKPSLNLLRRGTGAEPGASVDVTTGARTLHEVLAAFGVKGEIREARPGPVVTRYEFEPVRGTKLSRVIGLADDFARELGASAVRVAVTPGRTTIGIEVPNEMRDVVLLRDILESETFNGAQMQLPLALGKGIAGEPVTIDLARMPHLLVAGTTGSGKSVGLHAILLSLLYRHTPADLRLMLIDPKMLELSPYDRIPHLLNPVITDPQEAALALEWAVAEMDERYKRMARHGVRNIETFNARVRGAAETGVPMARTVHTGYDQATGQPTYEREPLEDAALPYIVIVIDELADLMVTAGRRVDGAVQRLAQKARAAGIHLVMATQRPSVDVVTGTIKANLPVRISYRVASKIDSRTIVGEPGAEQLLGNGDLLLASGPGQMLRVHGAFVSDGEIAHVAEALRDQGEPHYVEILDRPGSSKVADLKAARGAAEADEQDAVYAAAVAIVAGDRKVSPGHLHRRMGIGEDLAAQLIERMEADGLVGPVNLIGRRPIHMAAPARNAKPTARVA